MIRPNATGARAGFLPVLVATLGLASIPACNRTPTSPAVPTGANTSKFAGTVAGASLTGTLAVTVATATPAPAAGASASRAGVVAVGSLVLGSDPALSLSGTYDTGSHTLSLVDEGYVFSGANVAGTITGTFTGPSSTSGAFVLRANPGNSVRVYLGTFTSTSGGVSGNFNLVLDETGAIVGIAAGSDDSRVVFHGTLIGGNSVSIANPAGPGRPAFATGTLDPFSHTMTGDFDDGAGDSGTWTATLTQ